jgi:hypothetical protein
VETYQIQWSLVRNILYSISFDKVFLQKNYPVRQTWVRSDTRFQLVWHYKSLRNFARSEERVGGDKETVRIHLRVKQEDLLHVRKFCYYPNLPKPIQGQNTITLACLVYCMINHSRHKSVCTPCYECVLVFQVSIRQTWVRSDTRFQLVWHYKSLRNFARSEERVGGDKETVRIHLRVNIYQWVEWKHQLVNKINDHK